jgi:hypothetical protein
MTSAQATVMYSNKRRRRRRALMISIPASLSCYCFFFIPFLLQSPANRDSSSPPASSSSSSSSSSEGVVALPRRGGKAKLPWRTDRQRNERERERERESFVFACPNASVMSCVLQQISSGRLRSLSLLLRKTRVAFRDNYYCCRSIRSSSPPPSPRILP